MKLTRKEQEAQAVIQAFYDLVKQLGRGQEKVSKEDVELALQQKVQEIPLEDVDERILYHIEKYRGEKGFQIFDLFDYVKGRHKFLVLCLGNTVKKPAVTSYKVKFHKGIEEQENTLLMLENVNTYIGLAKILKKCPENYWGEIDTEERRLLFSRRNLSALVKCPQAIYDNISQNTLDCLAKILKSNKVDLQKQEKVETDDEAIKNNLLITKDKANIPKRTRLLMAQALEILAPYGVVSHIEFDEDLTKEQVSKLTNIIDKIISAIGKPKNFKPLTVRVRKLGNSRAKGKYVQINNSIIIDANIILKKKNYMNFANTFIHEYTHYVDLLGGFSENDIDFFSYCAIYESLVEQIPDAECFPANKKKYYLAKKEILARLMEVRLMDEIFRVQYLPEYKTPGYRIMSRNTNSKGFNKAAQENLGPIEGDVLCKFLNHTEVIR